MIATDVLLEDVQLHPLSWLFMHGTPAARAALTPRHELAGEAVGGGESVARSSFSGAQVGAYPTVVSRPGHVCHHGHACTCLFPCARGSHVAQD